MVRLMKILGIEHVAIAVEDLAAAGRVFGKLLSIDDYTRETIADQQVITDIFNTGGGKIELLKATSGESPIAKFMEKRGPGIHHIAFLVDDLSAWLKYLKSEDVQLIDQVPRIGAEGNLIAFIHPRSTGGVLVELCQHP